MRLEKRNQPDRTGLSGMGSACQDHDALTFRSANSLSRRMPLEVYAGIWLNHARAGFLYPYANLYSNRRSLNPVILVAGFAQLLVMKITSREALERTKTMLIDCWKLKESPASTLSLSTKPPKGLGKNVGQVEALEGPIDKNYFADVSANVSGPLLRDVASKTVGDLRTTIWKTIPKENRIE